MSKRVIEVRYRFAAATDATAVAGLHADSWRAHYRGAYSDGFLDRDVVEDRMAVWTERLASARPDSYTLLAESPDGIAAFAHTILDNDERWGALLENLHVAPSAHRAGVGTQLMALTAGVLLERAPSQGLYLWVLEQNTPAQAFYEALGGSQVESAPAPAPGGHPERLAGAPVRLRYCWPDPSVLLRDS